jgi:hypothetical protein
MKIQVQFIMHMRLQSKELYYRVANDCTVIDLRSLHHWPTRAHSPLPLDPNAVRAYRKLLQLE